MAHNHDIERGPGPIDGSVLYDQHKHVSRRICDRTLNFQVQPRNGNYCPENLDNRVLNYFNMAGFYGLYQIYYMRVDWGLIGALVERWRPESHTFHFPPGECTITLQDVEILGGIRVNGSPVIRNDKHERMEDKLSMVERLLGKRPTPDYYKSGCLSLKWVQDEFPVLDDNATPLQTLQYSRAMMLLMLGGNFLSDKSGGHAPLQFFPFLEDLSFCSQLSWGSAILSHLYMMLCHASTIKENKKINEKVHIAGPLILLQIWAWTRFTNICPVQNLPPAPNDGDVYPYGYRWVAAVKHYTCETTGHLQDWFRDQFDDLKDNQIIWMPYNNMMNILPDICINGHSIWRTRSPLIYFSCVEFHFPDRVLRQFGFIQNVPERPIRYENDYYYAHWKTRRGNSTKDWSYRNSNFVNLWNNRRQSIVEGGVGNITVANNYMEWYKNITRLRIGPTQVTPPVKGFMPVAGYHERMIHVINYCYRALRDDPTNPEHEVLLRTQYLPALGLPIPDGPPHIPPQTPQPPHIPPQPPQYSTSDAYIPNPFPDPYGPSFSLNDQPMGSYQNPGQPFDLNETNSYYEPFQQPSYHDPGQSSYYDPGQSSYYDPGQSSYQNPNMPTNTGEDIGQSTFDFFFR